MADENKIRDAADAIKGIVEAVPVYQDVVQPAAQQLGKGLETIAKLVHVALAPVSMVVWAYDQIADYLQETLAEKLKYVPPDKIVQPRMTIAGPTVEHLRFAADEPSLRELYANLLATSMDAKTAEEGHPAFVEVIRQLSSDEARVLGYLACSYPVICSLIYGRLYPVMMLSEDDEAWSHRIVRARGWFPGASEITCLDVDPSNTLAVASNCEYPHLIQSYLDNLHRLGLVSIEDEAGNPGLDWAVLEMRGEEYIMGAVERFIEKKELADKLKTVYFQGTSDTVTFTAFGKQFCRACILEGTHGPDANH